MTATPRATIRPRLLFINRSFWPDAEASGQLLTELCEDLSSRFEVCVIAGQPNQNPEGRSYRTRGCQHYHGVRVYRVWHTRFSKARMLGRALNYATFLVAAAIRGLFVPRPEVVIVETDPPLLCFVGTILKVLRGCQLVVYLQDIYPDLAVALGKVRESFAIRILRRAIFWTYRRADRVVILSRDMRALLVESGVPQEQILCIPNWVDTRALQPVKLGNLFRTELGLEGQFVVAYSGNLGYCQQLENVLAAASKLAVRSEITFLMIGDGASKETLEAQARRENLTNVRFLPYQPKDCLSQSLSAADLHLVPIDPRVTSCLMPSKLYGILASATPVVAIAPAQCELAEIVRSEEVGMVCRPGDPSELAQCLEMLSTDRDRLLVWGQRARELAESRYDRLIATGQFAALLLNILGESGCAVVGASSEVIPNQSTTAIAS